MWYLRRPASVSPPFRWDTGWTIIAIAAAISVLLPWPVLVVIGCVALSRYRGPNHYTKFMVPLAYRFKWDPVWIVLAALAVPSAFMVYAGFNGSEMGAWSWIAAGVFIVATLRVVVWLCFRFPLMSWFFVILFAALVGLGRFGRIWW